MFERYTEKARRVIFCSRYEASQFGSPYIETEHLLLGLIREDKAHTRRFLPRVALQGLRQKIEKHTVIRERVATSVDLPLSNESRRALAYAAEEADGLTHKHIGTEHLFLGLQREEKCFAAQLLTECGLRLETVRAELAKTPHEEQVASHPLPASTAVRPSTALIRITPTHPLIGRDTELERILHILGCFNAKNPVLVGDLGVGKRAIVGGLAQRIRDGAVPRFVAEASLYELDLPPWGTIDSAGFERLQRSLPKVAELGGLVFVDELHTPTNGVFGRSASRLREILKRFVVSGQLQCISVATPAWNVATLEVVREPLPSEPGGTKTAGSLRWTVQSAFAHRNLGGSYSQPLVLAMRAASTRLAAPSLLIASER